MSFFPTGGWGCTRFLTSFLSLASTNTSLWSLTGREGCLWVPGERPWETAHSEGWIGVKEMHDVQRDWKAQEATLALFMGSELEQGDTGDIVQIPLEGWERNSSKMRKIGGDGIQEGGSEGETQADNGTERTEADVSGWAWRSAWKGRCEQQHSHWS